MTPPREIYYRLVHSRRLLKIEPNQPRTQNVGSLVHTRDHGTDYIAYFIRQTWSEEGEDSHICWIDGGHHF